MAIVVSLLADDLETLRRCVASQAALADILELRLDRIGNPGTHVLRSLMEEHPCTWIAACHGREAHGDHRGTRAERLAILRDAAQAGASFVDVDWRLAGELGALDAPCERIVSRHEPAGMPPDLDEVLRELGERMGEGDHAKLVPQAACCEDGLRLLRWMERQLGLIAFASGEAGRFTRVLAPIFGSPLTYAAPARIAGEPELPATAPGQLRVDELRAMLPESGPGRTTAIFGVVGSPIAHSLSPVVHGAALRAAGVDAVYVAFEPRDFGAFLGLLGDERFRGLSITAPFKEAALAAAGRCDELARRTGAANTLVREGQGWIATNTDVPAIQATLEAALAEHGCGAEATGDPPHVLVLGAGGAARAAALAASIHGARVTLAARELRKAEALARELGCAATTLDALAGLEHDLLLNATPVGSTSAPGELPVSADCLRPGSVVLDCAYRPARTPLLRAAEERGCSAISGEDWFLRQAALQFLLFTGHDPDEERMRGCFREAVGE